MKLHILMADVLMSMTMNLYVLCISYAVASMSHVLSKLAFDEFDVERRSDPGGAAGGAGADAPAMLSQDAAGQKVQVSLHSGMCTCQVIPTSAACCCPALLEGHISCVAAVSSIL